MNFADKVRELIRDATREREHGKHRAQAVEQAASDALVILDHIASSDCECDPSVGAVPCLSCDAYGRAKAIRNATSLPPEAAAPVAWCARRPDGTLVHSDDDELPTTTIPDHVGWLRGLDMAFPMFAPHTLVGLYTTPVPPPSEGG